MSETPRSAKPERLYKLVAGGQAWTRPRPVTIVPLSSPDDADCPLTLKEAFRFALRVAGWDTGRDKQ